MGTRCPLLSSVLEWAGLVGHRDPGNQLNGAMLLAAPRGTHLWEFIRDILIHPELNEGLMKWENRHEGVFKFLRSEAVAQLWGQKKKNSNMTYEKLSRAMRWVSCWLGQFMLPWPPQPPLGCHGISLCPAG